MVSTDVHCATQFAAARALDIQLSRRDAAEHHEIAAVGLQRALTAATRPGNAGNHRVGAADVQQVWRRDTARSPAIQSVAQDNATGEFQTGTISIAKAADADGASAECQTV